LKSKGKSDKNNIRIIYSFLLKRILPMATHLITHRDCLFHDTGYNHPETADRLRMVWQYLEDEGFEALIRHEATLGEDYLLHLVHAGAHIAHIRESQPKTGYARIDPDTSMSPGSYNAALRGVGGVRDAIDLVMATDNTNAFVATRPPGHHAEADKSMGFCLFNQIAIGARYAQQRKDLSKIAIVDFDVHHGNGTQAIFETDPAIFYGSTHQEAPFYPNSGHSSETGAGNIFNAPLPAGSGSEHFQEAMNEIILPALVDFDPDLILISAGFDGHEDDPCAGLNLAVDDYRWVTEQLAKIANKCCHGKLVSVLEGGYDLEALGQSASAHVKALLAA
jgi:acetoin utilization deacetylase AcuC-like enzyme